LALSQFKTPGALVLRSSASPDWWFDVPGRAARLQLLQLQFTKEG